MSGVGNRPNLPWCAVAARHTRWVMFTILTLNDLHLGLRDLVDARLDAHEDLHAVRAYRARFVARLDELRALPIASADGEPFADELATLDQEHDAHGSAIWFYIEAAQRSPMVSAEVKVSLEALRQRYIPTLSELKRPLADEAVAAMRREPELAAHKATLKAVPVAGGRTLYDWFVAWTKAGLALDATLRKRAATTTGSRANAGSLRGATVGLLNRFRGAVADELEGDAERAAAVDTAMFGYLDTLERRRAASADRTVAKEPATPTPTKPSVAPPAAPVS